MKKLLLMLLFIFAGTIFAVKPETPPGAGTKDSPYQLSKYEHLLWIGNPITNNYVYATITADIDAYDDYGLNIPTNGYGWIESDNYLEFYGSLDGQGHTICDLANVRIHYNVHDDYTYTYTNYYGVFDFEGECSNLNIACKKNAGRFASDFCGTASVIRVTGAVVDVDGDYYRSHFAGTFYGSAENIEVKDGGRFASEFYGTAGAIQVSGSTYVHGYYEDEDEEWSYWVRSVFVDEFYGTAESIQISDSGRFADYASSSIIRNVTAQDSFILSEARDVLLERATVEGVIDLKQYGYDYDYMGGCIRFTDGDCVIRNVAVTANIIGDGYDDEYFGGIIAYDYGSATISNCYFSGKIDRSAYSSSGIIGYSYYEETYITDCYYDLTRAPLKSSYYGTAVFPEELRMKKTFQNWDFENVWNIEEGISTPTLKVIDKDGFEMIVADGLSKTTVSLKGTLTDEDVKAIQDSSEICLYSTGSGLEITARQTLDETALQVFSFKKKEEATISYKGKNKAFKFSSPVPSITVGKKSGSSFSPCTLSGSKMKLNSSARLFKDVSDYLKDKASVSLCDLEMADSVLEGTAVKLTQKGKNLSYKSNETGVMLSVKVNPTKKTVTVKYTGENYVQPTIWRDTKKR